MKRKAPYLRLWIKPSQLDYDAIHWYENANTMFLNAFGSDANLFIDILSATSPRLQVKANLRIALKVYKAYTLHQSNLEKFREFEHHDIGRCPWFRASKESAKELGDILGRLMPAHLMNVLRAFQGKPLSGEKVRRFAQNLKGDLSVVTIDMWICQSYGLPHKKLTPLQYARLEKKIQGEAIAANLKPAQYQALLWYAARRKGGYVTDQSFVKHYETLFPEFGLEVR